MTEATVTLVVFPALEVVLCFFSVFAFACSWGPWIGVEGEEGSAGRHVAMFAVGGLSGRSEMSDSSEVD